MKKIIAGLIVLFSMGVALIAFAAEKPAEKSCANTDHDCLYKQNMDAGDYAKALDESEKLLVENGKSGRNWYRKARALHKLDKKELAVDAYETAMENGYESFYALNNVGLLYMELGHNDRAMDRLEAAVAMDGAEAYAFSNLGAVYMRKGMLEKARKVLMSALDLDPDYDLAAARLDIVEQRIAKQKDKSKKK